MLLTNKSGAADDICKPAGENTARHDQALCSFDSHAIMMCFICLHPQIICGEWHKPSTFSGNAYSKWCLNLQWNGVDLVLPIWIDCASRICWKSLTCLGCGKHCFTIKSIWLWITLVLLAMVLHNFLAIVSHQDVPWMSVQNLSCCAVLWLNVFCVCASW